MKSKEISCLIFFIGFLDREIVNIYVVVYQLNLEVNHASVKVIDVKRNIGIF
jgi:hypothetical protein